MKKWLADLIKKLLEAIAKWAEKCIPDYDPGYWNDGGLVQLNNNCYNYGCNIKTNTFAQPGRAHGITLSYSDLDSCTAVNNGAVADGLKTVECDKGCGCEKCHHQLALVLWPGMDYHWYRKDRDGKWSHKPGQTQATNLDNSGNIISDPRNADRGPYTVFCGCFCVDKSAVSIN